MSTSNLFGEDALFIAAVHDALKDPTWRPTRETATELVKLVELLDGLLFEEIAGDDC